MTATSLDEGSDVVSKRFTVGAVAAAASLALTVTGLGVPATAAPTSTRLQTYTNEGRPAEFDALCEGDRNFNGFYSYGVVDAYAAVKTPLHR